MQIAVDLDIPETAVTWPGVMANLAATIQTPRPRQVFPIKDSSIWVEIWSPRNIIAEIRILDVQGDLLLQSSHKMLLKGFQRVDLHLQDRVRSWRDGWLQMQLRFGDHLLDQAVFGLGYVFLTAGQSNAANGSIHHHEVVQRMDDQKSASEVNAILQAVENRFPSRIRRRTDQVVALDEAGDFVQIHEQVPLVDDRMYNPIDIKRSVWPFLGDWIALKYRCPVAFINTGVFGSSIAEWVKGDRRLVKRFEAARGIGLDAVLWHQGESDGLLGTSQQMYRQALQTLIRISRDMLGKRVPWLVAIAEKCGDNAQDGQGPVAAAQRDIIAEDANVFMGPEADAIPHDCHFHADQELESLEKEWMTALENAGVLP